MEVCPLSRRRICLFKAPFLSVSLQNGLCFFHPHLPAVLSVYLAVYFPKAIGTLRAYHVPTE
jgi:hypothetical protein